MHASTRRTLGVTGVLATAMILLVVAPRRRGGGRHRRLGAHVHETWSTTAKVSPDSATQKVTVCGAVSPCASSPVVCCSSAVGLRSTQCRQPLPCAVVRRGWVGAVAPDDPHWVEVDPLLFSGQRIQTTAALRQTFGIALREAIVAAGERFELLSQTRRADFTVPLDGYWDGFYS